MSFFILWDCRPCVLPHRIVSTCLFKGLPKLLLYIAYSTTHMIVPRAILSSFFILPMLYFIYKLLGLLSNNTHTVYVNIIHVKYPTCIFLHEIYLLYCVHSNFTCHPGYPGYILAIQYPGYKSAASWLGVVCTLQ